MTDLRYKRTEYGVHSPEAAERFSDDEELSFDGLKETVEGA